MGGISYTMVETTKLSTAEIYSKTLADLAEIHPEIVVLTSDLAKSTKIGTFMERFPHRFYNMGIAEQNMFGTAAGMARCGLVPVTSAFGIFTSMRGLDQVHTDICYPNLHVIMIGSHSGTSFGQAGTTHHCTEDIAIMRSLANCTVIVPADGMETSLAVQAAYEHKGPVYIRINRGFDQRVYDNMDYGFELGKAQLMADGTDITLIACGSCVFQAVEAAKVLREVDKLSVRVLNLHTIKPIDEEAILAAVKDTRRIITAEDHTVMGGMGSAVAEVVAEGGMRCKFKRLGLQDVYSPIGLHEDLMAHHGIDINGILQSVREMMKLDFEEDDDWEDEV